MLYLASQSPRRRQLLEQIGVNFRIVDVEVPEHRTLGESPRDYVSRVAREKARAGLAVLEEPGAAVLGADTEVVLDDEVFGKPDDAEDAALMLRRLSGRVHEVISTVWLVTRSGEWSDTSLSRVTMPTLDSATITAYIATGEPFGKAGAYGIQGHGAKLIEHLDGSHSGVMGMPIYETARLLRSHGLIGA